MTFLFSLLAVFFAMPSCGTSSSNEATQQENVVEEMIADTVDVIAADTATYYSDVVDKKNCFILISKPELRLYVCEVVDGDTLKDDTVTLRFRDTMEQKRVKISELQGIIEDNVTITSLLKKL